MPSLIYGKWYSDEECEKGAKLFQEFLDKKESLNCKKVTNDICIKALGFCFDVYMSDYIFNKMLKITPEEIRKNGKEHGAVFDKDLKNETPN